MILAAAGLWVVFLIAASLILTPSYVKRAISTIAAKNVEGKVEFSGISISVLKNFPHLYISLKDICVTNTDKSTKNISPDTLASFERLSLSLNYSVLITGKLHIYKSEISNPRIFARYNGPESANWKIFKPDDSRNTGIKKLDVDKVSISGKSMIRFADLQDSVFAVIRLRKMIFHGKFSCGSGSMGIKRINLDLDSMSITGRTPADTAGIFLDKLKIKQKRNRRLDFNAKSMTSLGFDRYGRWEIPVKINGKLEFPKSDNTTVYLKKFKAEIADVPIKGKAMAIFYGDSTYIKASAGITGYPVKNLTEYISRHYFPEAKDFRTNASMILKADCEGYYSGKNRTMPDIHAEFSIPKSAIEYKRLAGKGNMEFSAKAGNGKKGKIYAGIKNSYIKLPGIYLNGSFKTADMFGKDPEYETNTKISVSLDSLCKIIHGNGNTEAHGKITAILNGDFRRSRMDIYNFTNTGLIGSAVLDNIFWKDGKDSISFCIGNADIRLSPREKRYGDYGDVSTTKKEEKARVLSADFDSVYLNWKTRFSLHSGNMKLEGKDSIEGTANNKETSESYFAGLLSADNIHMMFKDSLSMEVSGTENGFALKRQGYKRSNTVSFTSVGRSEKLILKTGANILAFNNLSVSAETDSLRKHNLKGYISAERGKYISPYFPEDNEISDTRCSFETGKIKLEHLKFISGESGIIAGGEFPFAGRTSRDIEHEGIRLNITSDGLDANKLLKIYRKGKNSAIRIPSGLNAVISIKMDNVRYSNLIINKISAETAIHGMCARITGASASSNIGEFALDGFYSAGNMANLKTGFDLRLSNITSDKMINLFPATDSLMPMLKSFKGNLDFEMAATSDLDSLMDFIKPSLDGIIRIKGTGLSIHGTGNARKLAGLLMFGNGGTELIDNMDIYGLIRNNKLEILPCTMNIGKSVFAVSGEQVFGKNFNYHISVLKSPVPFRFGIDISGNTDNWNYHLVKAKYKNADIPDFSAHIDAIRRSLSYSINNIFDIGAEKAIRNKAEAEKEIDKIKYAHGYSASSDSLDTIDKRRIDSLYNQTIRKKTK
jgi:hypothetical protein